MLLNIASIWQLFQLQQFERIYYGRSNKTVDEDTWE